MRRTIIATEAAPAPVGPYSQAVSGGGLVFVSGQIAIDPATGQLRTGDVEEETRLVLENMKAVLRAAGSGLDRVLKTTIFLKDMGDFARVNAVYATYFTVEPPARACVEAARLPKDVSVEIECVALAGS